MPLVILKVRLSPSTSLADKLVDPLSSSSKLTLDIVASTGASLTADTYIETTAVSVNSPSDTVKVKLSEPL